MLPPDNHVHSEWSWDAVAGSMERSCARAVELGLPSIAFTEHLDLTRWVITPEAHATLQREAVVAPAAAVFATRVGADGRFNPPSLNVDGYMACVQRCRERYPALRILSGIELGEPHWFEDESKAMLASATFERVLGSLHSLMADDGPWIVNSVYDPSVSDRLEPAGIVRAYLAEALKMVESSTAFAVLAHIDYSVRAWPADAGRFDPEDFKDEYRAVLRALARSGRTLEVNTRLPLHPKVVRWWREAGGETVCFGSDAHDPSTIARHFAETAAMVEAQGFRPGRAPHDFWVRGAQR